MRRLGIIDIGSNTIRMVVFARQSSGGFRLHDDLRERVRLGAGLGTTGKIEPARLRRALVLLAQFADYGRGARLDDLEVFGTSALRDASNGERLVEGVRDLGLQLRVLEGEDEARYGVLAVANRFDLDNAWVMDLGGGSAQVSRMEQRQFRSGRSYPLGAVRLAETRLRRDPPREKDIAAVEALLEAELGAVAAAMRETAEPLIVIGGAVRNLARAVQIENAYPLDLLHGYWLSTDDLGRLTEHLLRVDAAARAETQGIHPDRADVIHAAAMVFRWLLRASGRDGLLVSGGGVREGALYRHVLRPPHLVAGVGKGAIDGLVEQHVVDQAHAASVAGLAEVFFDALAEILGLELRDRVLLVAAARLHESGLSIYYYRQQKHGAFLLHAKALDGFTHREQVMIMLMIRHHKKGHAKLSPWNVLLRKDDEHRMAGLLACLRLAIALDRSRGGRIEDVEVAVAKRSVTVRFTVDDEASVEAEAVRAVQDDVAVALGRPLLVEPTIYRSPKPDPRIRPSYEGR